jgi:hypothetical protein
MRMPINPRARENQSRRMVYEFEDIERAFEDSKQGRTIKPILRIAKL